MTDALFVYSTAPPGTIVTAPRPHVEPTPRYRRGDHSAAGHHAAGAVSARRVAMVGVGRTSRRAFARADYRLTTNAGPLVVHVVAIDTHDPTVRLGAVVARDHMISNGETVSSMAARTGAVAGINADYFDIGNTNQPLNVVVRDRTLLRTPSKRAAIDVNGSGEVGIGYVTFTGTASYGSAQIPLTGVNEWPPQGGATLLTPAYGTLSAAPNVTVATLAAARQRSRNARHLSRYRGRCAAAGTGERRAAGLWVRPRSRLHRRRSPAMR